MTITVTPDPTFRPPRNIVEVEVPVVGAIMQSVSVWREENGVRTDLRAQPVPGFESRTVYDYECPYETFVSYGWSTTYTDSSTLTTLWAETWANLSAWTVTGASWSVSGGKLVWGAAADSTAKVVRSITPGRYRISFASVPVGVSRIDFGGFYVDLLNNRLVAGATYVSFTPGTTTWVIDVTETSVILTTSAGSYSITAGVTVTQAEISGPTEQLVYALQFGSFGTGNGQFGNTSYIAGGTAVDAAGYVYVVDQGNHRIQKFTSAGVYVTQWGSNGSGNGQFNYPAGIAFDASGNAWVTDAFNHRVQKFVPGATANDPHVYSSKFGSNGTADGTFNYPRGIVIDASGNVLVVDQMNNRVQKFSSAGAFVSKFGTPGTGNGQFDVPFGITIDTNNDILVVDTGNRRVQRFNSAHAYQSQFATVDSAGTAFIGNSIARDANRNFYVSYGAGLNPGGIVRYTNAGAYSSTVTSGDGTPLAYSRGMAISGTTFYVNDLFNSRVQKFSILTASVDDITIQSYSAEVSLIEQSAEVTLEPLEGWFVHPGSPGLSFPVAFEDWDDLYTLVAKIGDIQNADTSTRHEILGSEFPVITTTGPRLGDTTSIDLSLATLEADAALKALLRDQTPLLIQFPPSWGYGFPRAFYAVSQPRRMRELQIPADERRTAVLELQAVASPLVSQSNVGWSYAELALLASYQTVKAAFATYADLVTNVRNPGY